MPDIARCIGVCRGALVAALVTLGLLFPGGGLGAQETFRVGGALIASAGKLVLLRAQPGYDAEVLATLGDGSWLDVAGEPVLASDGSSWLLVNAGGQSGFVPAGYVTDVAAPEAEAIADPALLAPAVPDPATAPISAELASTSTDANLRTGPSIDTDVMHVIPPGTAVAIDGPAENGFVPVTANGAAGWVAAELLTTGTAPPAAEPAPLVATEAVAEPAAGAIDAAQRGRNKEREKDRASTGIAWPMTGGEWEVVQGYNTGTHANRSDFAQYKYSLDWARVDGESAGQPIVAPVSGTVQWIDRGSGGMLVDAGNGYGVALFHVTIDRDISRGSHVEQGQRLGQISGPGGDGYMEMAHFEIAAWQLTEGGHTSVPFTEPNAIGEQEFPDSGGTNQHMGARVSL